MRTINSILCLILLMSICISCKKTAGNANCKVQVKCYNIYFSGAYFRLYERSDLDTVIERIYQPDSTFSNLITQNIFTSPDSNDIDNGFIYNGLFFQQGYDYEVQIPRTNQVFRIYNIVNTDTTDSVSCDARYPMCFAHLRYEVTGGRWSIAQTNYTPLHLVLLKN